MLGEELSEELGDPDGAAAVVLGGPVVELASGFGYRLGDFDPGLDEITSSTPEGGRLSPAESAVGEQVDEGSVGLTDRHGEPVHLIGVEEQHRRFGLPGSPHSGLMCVLVTGGFG